MDVAADVVVPDWPAHPRVHAFVTTRASGDMAGAQARSILRKALPDEPIWLRQVHGTTVVEVDACPRLPEADAAVARERRRVCAVVVADCMPVLFSDAKGAVVGIAHAGWRGLAAGVIEATLAAMRTSPSAICAWLGPAIGPEAYEVGEEVRAAFAGYESAFMATRPGHWRLDLYAVARRRLEAKGVGRVCGGGFCTFTERDRFFSYRRDGTKARMAALLWLA
jgi:YfiH family protein